MNKSKKISRKKAINIALRKLYSVGYPVGHGLSLDVKLAYDKQNEEYKRLILNELFDNVYGKEDKS